MTTPVLTRKFVKFVSLIRVVIHGMEPLISKGVPIQGIIYHGQSTVLDSKCCMWKPYNHNSTSSLTLTSSEYDLLCYYSSRRTLELLIAMAIPAIGNGHPKLVS